ncbi:phenolpthiocerol synthesis polyketide synthase ppsB [Pseudozyma hubeiensis SY62]|uniref:Phenolpthiocerol synthesis polyketide synthase ppsB n=1 Tax=Pseudozyma hubeiensis (strain SY62) TaxID=1305764 RepID=R9PC16_PSEHS|nr:phenolpthiocerol synthesis polyketide synthase ppsB [Pseudozyma hubeiensis SY62]GAC98772.1 phenolpthiocerol synthesis polyketide synthase ppsB [Pseudozyma hubeiensis SY62]
MYDQSSSRSRSRLVVLKLEQVTPEIIARKTVRSSIGLLATETSVLPDIEIGRSMFSEVEEGEAVARRALSLDTFDPPTKFYVTIEKGRSGSSFDHRPKMAARKRKRMSNRLTA